MIILVALFGYGKGKRERFRRGTVCAKEGNRSRVEGDKRIVPKNYGERQEGQQFMGNDQEATWRVFLY